MSNKMKSNPPLTILTITIGFLVLYYFFEKDVLLYISMTIGLIGVFSTYLSKKIEYLWFGLARILSYIIPNVILTIIFYILLFPIALLSKLFNNKDHLNLKNNKNSLFIDNNKEFDKSYFEKMW